MRSFENRLEVAPFKYDMLINFHKEGDIIGIQKDGVVQKYKIEFDKDFELNSIEEDSTVWGACGETLEELFQALICDFVEGTCEDIDFYKE